MNKKKFNSAKGPGAAGPYSQGIVAEPFLFLSGQLGVDPESNSMVSGGIKNELKQIMENIKGILEDANLSLNHIVKTTVFIKDMENFSLVNKIYLKYFQEPYPARSAVGVKELPLNAEIEIEVIAIKS